MKPNPLSPNQVLVNYLYDSARYTYAPRTRDLIGFGVGIGYMPLTDSTSAVLTDFNTGKVNKVAFNNEYSGRAYAYMREAEYAGSKASFMHTYQYKSVLHMDPENLVRMMRIMEIEAQLDRAFKVVHDFCDKKIDIDNFCFETACHDMLPSAVLQSLCLNEATLKPDIVEYIVIEDALKNDLADDDTLRPQLMYLMSENKDMMQCVSKKTLQATAFSVEHVKKIHGVSYKDNVFYVGKNKLDPLKGIFDKNNMTSCVNRFDTDIIGAKGTEKADAFWCNVSALSPQDEKLITDIRRYEKKVFKAA